jgi:hypothetical protein
MIHAGCTHLHDPRVFAVHQQVPLPDSVSDLMLAHQVAFGHSFDGSDLACGLVLGDSDVPAHDAKRLLYCATYQSRQPPQ